MLNDEVDNRRKKDEGLQKILKGSMRKKMKVCKKS